MYHIVRLRILSFQTSMDCSYTSKKEFDAANNKELRTIEIHCEKCKKIPSTQKSAHLNRVCFKNIIKILKLNPDITDIILNTIEGILKLTKEQMAYLLDYSSILKKVAIPEELINRQYAQKCSEYKACETKRIHFQERILGNRFSDGLLMTDLIKAYQDITQEITIISRSSKENKKCSNCLKSYLQFLNKISGLQEKSRIIRKYRELNIGGKTLSKIYSIILGDFIHPLKNPASYPLQERSLRATYQVHGYKIAIEKARNSSEFFYKITSIIDDPELKPIFSKILHKTKANLHSIFDPTRLMKLNQVLHVEKELATQIILQEYSSLSPQVIQHLAELVSFEIVRLNPIMAPLLDAEIEELFLDSPQLNLYLDHRKYGRCQTNLSLTPNVIESLKTTLRIESEQLLDASRPYLKTEVITPYFHVRVTSETPTLAVDGFKLRIRKLNEEVLTIIDLLSNNTLTPEAAAYLLLAWFHGRCILVIGEPGSGKTTLINSLDVNGDKTWRKVYIEDVIESIDQSPYGVRQSRYQVNPDPESSENYSSKAYQVKETLHRTPDGVFIGELIKSDSVQAFFYSLEVGLGRCLATAHGSTLN